MGCAYPEYGPKSLKISNRTAERACFIYLLHNVRRLVAQSHLLKQTVANSQASTDPEVLLSASKSTEPDGLEVENDNFGVDVEKRLGTLSAGKASELRQTLVQGCSRQVSSTNVSRVVLGQTPMYTEGVSQE